MVSRSPRAADIWQAGHVNVVRKWRRMSGQVALVALAAFVLLAFSNTGGILRNLTNVVFVVAGLIWLLCFMFDWAAKKR